MPLAAGRGWGRGWGAGRSSRRPPARPQGAARRVAVRSAAARVGWRGCQWSGAGEQQRRRRLTVLRVLDRHRLAPVVALEVLQVVARVEREGDEDQSRGAPDLQHPSGSGHSEGWLDEGRGRSIAVACSAGLTKDAAAGSTLLRSAARARAGLRWVKRSLCAVRLLDVGACRSWYSHWTLMAEMGVCRRASSTNSLLASRLPPFRRRAGPRGSST